MYLLHRLDDGRPILEDFSARDKPPYAILSHTWGEDNEEVTFRDMRDGTGQEKIGYSKISFCVEQIIKDNLDYVWVDTCCIDKTNSAELSEAIVSMFKWYKEAAKCYVYLSDVSSRDMNGIQTKTWMSTFKTSRWFTRGWTLQELIAPDSVDFFSKEKDFLGNKHELVQEVSDATGIGVEVLEERKRLFQLSYQEKTSWVQHRHTKRGEDRAYSLLGILGVHMMPCYGEGEESAMLRLRRECSNRSNPGNVKTNHSKHRKTSKAASTAKESDRLKHMRHLCRLYEPLVLLYTLGSTEEDYIPVTLPTKEETSYLPPRTTRRNFLKDLAYLCDYDVGSDTVVAVAMQSLQQRHVLWIASNTSPARRIISFVESRLNDIQQISTSTGIYRSRRTEDFITACIEFAAPQIIEDTTCLIAALQKCKSFLEENSPEEGMWSHNNHPCSKQKTWTISNSSQSVPYLVEWMRDCACQLSIKGLCRSAYKSQRSRFMNDLARLSLQTRNSMTLGESQNPFDLIRRHVTQLGRRFQAAKALLTYGARIPELNGTVDVRPIDTPRESRLPPADMSTNFDSITRRMLPAGSRLDHYQHALAAMDISHNLFQHFLHNYDSGNVRPFVHAEIQVLDLFHKRQYLFADDDQFIACSRPVCLSCLTYFKSHPGRFVEPSSDYNICLSWRPPVPEAEDELSSKIDQRDTMNDFNESIRKEVLHQILRRYSITSNRAGFPNTATGTNAPAQDRKPTIRYQELLDQFQTLVGPRNQPDKGSQNANSSSATLVFAIGKKDSSSSRHAHYRWQTQLPPRLQLEVDKGLDDSDSMGGVPLAP